MHSASRVLAAIVVVSVHTGCYHYTATLPGVLDTRSDGSTADASPLAVSDEKLRRTGLSAWVEGDGVRADGAHVVVEERHFFAGITALLPGAFLLSNESPTPELEAALGDAALRELRLSHQYSAFDVAWTAVANLIPCVPLFLLPQPYTFMASGERVTAGGQPPVNRPVAPPVPSPPPAPPSPAEPSPADEKPPADEEPPADATAPSDALAPEAESAPEGEGAPTEPPSVEGGAP